MTKRTKIRIAGSTGAFFTIALAVGFLLSRLPGIEGLEQKTAAVLEQRYHIRPQRLEISFFPRPRAKLYRTVLSVPGMVEASAEEAVVYPKLLPLLKGEIKAGKIRLVRPVVNANLKEAPFYAQAAPLQERDGGVKGPFPAIREQLTRIYGLAVTVLPDADVEIEDANLDLAPGHGEAFRFEDVDVRAAFLRDGLKLELSAGKSSFWTALSFDGKIDLAGWKSSGRFDISGAQIQDLFEYLFPSAPQRVSGGEASASISFSSSGPDEGSAEFSILVPGMTLEDGEKVKLEEGSITGGLKVNREQLEVTLSQVRFTYPAFDLTGRLAVQRPNGAATLDLESRNTDAAAVRRAALVAGGEHPVIKKIFEIVREGDVPQIGFSARADSVSELKKPENFVIRGSLQNGKIFAPRAELMLGRVSGQVVISQGILEGVNLQGKTAGSAGTNGYLKVSLLRDPSPPFHLDIAVDADLSELPPVLERVVKNEEFKRELELVKDAKGRAQGRLILGESLKAIQAKVQTGPFELSGLYGRLHGPVRISGESFQLDGSQINFSVNSASAGKSSVCKTTVGYNWEQDHPLEISTREKAVIALEDLNPLVLSREHWKKILNGNGAPIKGTATLDFFEFAGPLSASREWSISTGGSIGEMLVHAKPPVGQVEFKSGTFEASRDVLSIKDFHSLVSDSGLVLSGSITGYLDAVRSVDLTASGRTGPEGGKKITEAAGLPPQIRSISVMNIANARLVWTRGETISVAGEFRAPGGPAVTLDAEHTPGQLSIRRLALKDEDSDAVLALRIKGREFDLDYSGVLSNRTADRLLAENHLLKGLIRGKMRAHVNLDKPMDSTAEGQLDVTGFEFPWDLKTPAHIENVSLDARGNRLVAKSGIMTWNGSRMGMTGAVTLAPDSFKVDMNLSVNALKVEDIIGMRKQEETQEGPEEEPRVSNASFKAAKLDAPLRGVIRVKTDQLQYKQYTWTGVEGEAVLSPGGTIDLSVGQADICGISTPGEIRISPDGVSLSVQPEAKDQDLQAALGCFLGKKHVLTGKYGLKGRLTAHAAPGGRLAESLQGNVEFTAKDGRFFQFDLLTKIFGLLNFTEVYRGKLPDLGAEGCEYEHIKAGGTIKNGRLTLAESEIDGPCLKTAWRGGVDLVNKKLDLVAVVAPLRTVDRIVSLVPMLGRVLNDSLISIPVQINGDLDNPSVVPLSPAAVGSQLSEFMKRTFKLPFTIFQPLL